MKKMFIAAAVAVAFVAVTSAQGAKTSAPAQTKEAPKAAEQTWAGKISDGMCGADHHGKADVDCTVSCVKGGAEYVFVGDKNKVFKIANQKFADLAKQAGHTVELTGTAKGDTITVTKIAAKK